MASPMANSKVAPEPTVMVRPTVVILPKAETVGLLPWEVAEVPVTETLPPVIVMLPVRLLEPPESVSVPLPDLDKPAVPLITPERV